MMCEHYRVSRSGFYSRQARAPSARAQSDAELTTLITQVHQDVKGRYGSPRVTKFVRQQGHSVGRGRVARLMRQAGLQGISNHLFARNGHIYDRLTAAPNNILAKQITKTNQVWVGDVTYLKVAGKWRYLAVVMDRFSRRILGWGLAARRTAALTCAAMTNALRNRPVTEGIHFHSDRGSEYAARAFKNKLRRHGFIQSMNRPGSMNDNAHMESFFHSLKIEGLYRQKFNTEQPLRSSLYSYFHFYNEQRLHSSLEYLPPVSFERKHLTQLCVH
jgi:putative transposase